MVKFGLRMARHGLWAFARFMIPQLEDLAHRKIQRVLDEHQTDHDVRLARRLGR